MNLALNILTTLSARIIILVLALVSSIVLARTLGPEGQGLFALVLLLPELAKSFSLLGFDQANAVYAGLESEKRSALVWHSAIIAGVVGGLTTAAGMGFLIFGAPGSHALLRGPLWLYLLPLSIVPGGLVVEYWGAIIRGMNRILLLNFVEVGRKVVSLTLVVTLVAVLRLGVIGAVWADFTLHAGAAVLMVALLRWVGVLGGPSFDRPLWGRTWRFALPVYCGTITSFLNYRADQFIIAVFLPPEQLGFYVIAVGLAERLWILTGAVANALLPHLTNSREHDPALAAVIARHVMLWTGTACLLVFVVADVAVELMYSSAFAPTVAPLRWLLPGIFTLAAGKVLVAEILAREKVRIVWASACGAVVNIAANLVLVPRMGASGAALASSISYSLLSLIIMWYYLRVTGVSWTTLLPRWSDLRAYTVLWRRPTTVTLLGGGYTAAHSAMTTVPTSGRRSSVMPEEDTT